MKEFTGNALIVTVGLPRSGKSTWARQQGHPMVNPDSVRLALHGQRFVLSAESFVWATVEVMIRSLFRAGHRTVILDATNVSRKRRNRWKSDEWATVFKVFNTTPAECKRRADMDKDAEIIPVIDRMLLEWNELGEDEQALEEL